MLPDEKPEEEVEEAAEEKPDENVEAMGATNDPPEPPKGDG